VAITKTFPFEMVAMAHAMGIRHVGENRVEEASRKIVEAKNAGMNDIVWHMVGHVQSRKAKEVVKYFDWIDSVDSVKIAQKLNSLAAETGKTLHILLEVNVSGEKSKSGFNLAGWETDSSVMERFISQIKEIMQLSQLVIEGIMTMPPLTSHPEENGPVFQSARKLSETIRAQIPSFGAQLSMGTSQDYEVAIQEGATQVRLGEALFGGRKIAKEAQK
jgi:pyridoxal phosphate enzyme (YggS family)